MSFGDDELSDQWMDGWMDNISWGSLAFFLGELDHVNVFEDLDYVI